MMPDLSAMIGLTPPIHGGCRCGRVAYVGTAPPVWSVNCHCSACRLASGAPYVTAFCVPAGAFEVIGVLASFERLSEAGHRVTTWHCAECGSRICAQSAGNRQLMNVFASTLSDASTFTAISNVYLSEAAAWIDPPPARFNFDRMPGA